MKNIRISIWKLLVFGGEILNIFDKACFRNEHSMIMRARKVLITAHMRSLIWAFVVRICPKAHFRMAQLEYFPCSGSSVSDCIVLYHDYLQMYRYIAIFVFIVIINKHPTWTFASYDSWQVIKDNIYRQYENDIKPKRLSRLQTH